MTQRGFSIRRSSLLVNVALLAVALGAAVFPALAHAMTHRCVSEASAARQPRPGAVAPEPVVPVPRVVDAASAPAAPTREQAATLQRLRIESCRRHPQTCTQAPAARDGGPVDPAGAR